MSDFDGQSTGDTGTEFEQRWETFQDTAQATEGPLGNLFQTIAFMHQKYCDDAECHVTSAESARMIQIVEAAMVASEWLHAPGAISLDQALAELVGQITEPESAGRHRKPEPPECEVA